jgi:hypothetical protein
VAAVSEVWRSQSVALTFDELRTNYGDELGEVIEHQFGLLWQVVARGGEPIRKSNVEHKNIISFVLYVEHYHEKDLRDQRRAVEAILNNA